MRLFRRDVITVRCAFRRAVLSVPHAQRLIDDCPPDQQRRLLRRLEKAGEDEGWAVEWRKSAGQPLHPHDTVAVLSRGDIVVELVSARRGVLSEVLISEGEQAASGARLAMLGKTARLPQPRENPQQSPYAMDDLLRRFVARQRSDAAAIRRLETDLAEYQRMADRLSREVYTLRAGLLPGGSALPDLKIKRLKHEFSKRFHPDAHPPGDPDRVLWERVFREFWPILEEIECSEAQRSSQMSSMRQPL
jgi:hypothetical protein